MVPTDLHLWAHCAHDARIAMLRISRAQMEVYARYGGDINGLARIGTVAERELMPSDAWRVVDRLRAALVQVRSGVVAPEYAARIEAEVASEFADPEAKAILLRFVERDAVAL